MTKAELLRELEEKFNSTKKELGFKTSFEDIEEIVFIKDAVLRDGFVSEHFSRQLCAKIRDLYMSWANYLHTLLIPVPGNMIALTESKALGEEDKKQAMMLINKALVFGSTNIFIGLTTDKKEEAKFIDDSIKFWKETFSPKATTIIKKIQENWKRQ